MAITFVGAGLEQGGGLDAGFTAQPPAGIQTNDILILHIESHGDGTGADAGPTGWTLLATAESDSGTLGDETCHTVYYTVYNSGSPPSYVVPGESGRDHCMGIVTAWRGVDTSNIIDAYQTSSTATPAASFSASGITTTVANTMVIVSVSHGDNGALGNTPTIASTGAAVAADVLTTQGNDGYVGVWYLTRPTASSTGPSLWDFNASGPDSEKMAAVQFALRPSVTADPADTLWFPGGHADYYNNWDRTFNWTNATASSENSGHTNRTTFSGDSSGLGACWGGYVYDLGSATPGVYNIDIDINFTRPSGNNGTCIVMVRENSTSTIDTPVGYTDSTGFFNVSAGAGPVNITDTLVTSGTNRYVKLYIGVQVNATVTPGDYIDFDSWTATFTPATGGPVIKVHNGTNWTTITGVVKVHNGSGFQPASISIL